MNFPVVLYLFKTSGFVFNPCLACTDERCFFENWSTISWGTSSRNEAIFFSAWLKTCWAGQRQFIGCSSSVYLNYLCIVLWVFSLFQGNIMFVMSLDAVSTLPPCVFVKTEVSLSWSCKSLLAQQARAYYSLLHFM